MGFVDLLVVAVIPVIQLLLATAVGLFMAVDSVNLLGPVARHSLNNLVYFVFCPALVISSLAETITFESLVSLWFMPVNILLTFIIGSALAWFLIQITTTPPHLHGLVIGCCSAGNLGNLLLIVVPAVCQEANSPFGDSSVCSTSGEAYASLSMAVGAIYIWSYVYIIMRVCANKSIAPIGDDSTANIDILKESSKTCLESCKENLLPSSMHGAEMPGSGSVKRMQVPVIKKMVHFINMIAEKIEFKMIFAPSTVAAILGFMIGSISPIRKALIGDSAPLRALNCSASLLGEPATPCMTLIIGANLLNGLKRSGVGLPVIVGVILVRYLFMPLLGIGVVKAACSFGMVGSDPLYQFVLMIQYAVPPGMSVGIIAELLEVGESECSVIMLWSYLLGAFSLTIWSTFYMWILA
ncbi:PIN-LIKES 3 [Hibiscus trionum]|uniref:PIN-LIKES 3 n=1 Tax=Hibiscus trionum TaxID=183268 RepID=A0A9W7ITI2_HIBTR|nr:PIN-LIKES 3 [Hibiscus trionum]